MHSPELYYSLMGTNELERLARLGDIGAQDEVERRAKDFATSNSHFCKKQGFTKDEFQQEFKR